MNAYTMKNWWSRLHRKTQRALQHLVYKDVHLQRPNIHALAQMPAQLPLFVQESAVAMRYLHLLGPLDWDRFPERNLERNWGIPAVPYLPFVAACLVKVDQVETILRIDQHVVRSKVGVTYTLGMHSLDEQSELMPGPW